MKGVLFLLFASLQFTVVVDVSERKLLLLNEKNEVITSLMVAVPRWELKEKLKGRVVKIEIDPWWYPTEEIRKEYFQRTGKLLPKAIPPGDPKNAMGKAKLIIDFENTNLTIRIHGTNDESSIGRPVTHGCIRLKNNDILHLINLIRGKQVYAIIQP